MSVLTREWLAEQAACDDDYSGALRELAAPDIPLTWEAFRRAQSLGLNLIWLGARLVSVKERREFVLFTVGQRAAAVTVLLGREPPRTAKGLREAASAVWNAAPAEGYVQARNAAAALREMARDMACRKAGAWDVELAAAAALRAISWGGGEEANARREQEGWLGRKVLGEER